MEVHQLRYVCAVADTGTFSRAAEQCRVAQPSLSQQVLKLEAELGAKLFDRLGRRVRLTEAGRAFLPRARAILHQLDAARAGIADTAGTERGSLSAGVIPTVAPFLMPPAVARFAHAFPAARLRVIEATTPALIDGLRSLALDLAVLALPLRHREFELFALRTEPLYAVLPKRHPRAAAQSLSLRELRTESFVMLRDGHCFRGLSLSVCGRAHIRPRISFESDQFSSLLGMVAAGLGVTLVPQMAIVGNPACRYIPLTDARASRTIVAAVLRGRSLNRLQQAFLDQLRATP